MNDYATIRRDYRWDCPARFNFARDVIDRWAAADPAQPAMLWVDDHGGEERRTFADIAAASRRVANVLAGAGVARGDRVVMLLGRQIAWWEVLTACLRMGAVASPGTAQLSAKDLAYRINAAGATCVVTDTGNAAKVDAVLGECPSLKVRVLVDGPRDGWIDYATAVRAASEAFVTVDSAAHDEALCYFTSGTTGHPKMCMHAHSYGLAHQTTGRYWLDLKPSDLHWNLQRHRLGQGGVEQLFRAVELRRGDLRAPHAGLQRQAHAGTAGDAADHHLLRRADRLPHARAGGPRALPLPAPAPLRRRRRAAEPRGDRDLAQGHGTA